MCFYICIIYRKEKPRKVPKRQASILALRFITDEYYMALGVWAVRQATRHALKSKPITFSDKNLMMKYAKLLIKKKFNFDLDYLITKSKLLSKIKHQKKLVQF